MTQGNWLDIAVTTGETHCVVAIDARYRTYYVYVPKGEEHEMWLGCDKPDDGGPFAVCRVPRITDMLLEQLHGAQQSDIRVLGSTDPESINMLTCVAAFKEAEKRPTTIPAEPERPKHSTDSCDPEVFEKGVAVLLIGEGGRENIEVWVQKFAAAREQKMDWSYMAGRAIVKVLCSRSEARKTQEWLASDEGAELRAELDAYGRDSWTKLGLEAPPHRESWGFYLTGPGIIGQELPPVDGELNLRREAQYAATFATDPLLRERSTRTERDKWLDLLAPYALAALVEIGRLEDMLDDQKAAYEAALAKRDLAARPKPEPGSIENNEGLAT